MSTRVEGTIMAVILVAIWSSFLGVTIDIVESAQSVAQGPVATLLGAIVIFFTVGLVLGVVANLELTEILRQDR